jgi:hypothetical protein
MDKLLNALREERDGCARRGLTDRVAAIDAEIARLTGAPARAESAAVEVATVEPQTETAARKPVKRRKV